MLRRGWRRLFFLLRHEMFPDRRLRRGGMMMVLSRWRHLGGRMVMFVPGRHIRLRIFVRLRRGRMLVMRRHVWLRILIRCWRGRVLVVRRHIRLRILFRYRRGRASVVWRRVRAGVFLVMRRRCAVGVSLRLQELLFLFVIRQCPQPGRGGQEQDHRDNEQHGITAHGADGMRTCPCGARGQRHKACFFQFRSRQSA